MKKAILLVITEEATLGKTRKPESNKNEEDETKVKLKHIIIEK